jgi:hypothetical protein
MSDRVSGERVGSARFRAARDFPLRHRPDYDAAYQDFTWPELDEFNRLQFAELPKTISGKIRRVELRSRERDLHSGGGAASTGEYADTDFAELSLQHRAPPGGPDGMPCIEIERRSDPWPSTSP